MRPIVALARCRDYEDCARALEDVVAPLGGFDALVSPGERVLLKPNFVVPRDAGAAVNTHPAFIAAVARRCLERGAKVVVADSPAVGSAHRVADRIGLSALLADLDVPIVDLSRSPRVRYDLPRSKSTVYIAQDVLDADAVINLPKLKVHCQLTITLAVKNLFGTVVARRKALLHAWLGGSAERFATMLHEVVECTRPRVTLLDGVVGLDRNGPTSGEPRTFGLLAAGREPMAIDTVLMDLLGVDPELVPVYRAARRHELGTWRLEDIDVAGEPAGAFRIDDLHLPISMPVGFSVPHLIRGVIKHAWAYFKERRAPLPAK